LPVENREQGYNDSPSGESDSQGSLQESNLQESSIQESSLQESRSQEARKTQEIRKSQKNEAQEGKAKGSKNILALTWRAGKSLVKSVISHQLPDNDHKGKIFGRSKSSRSGKRTAQDIWKPTPSESSTTRREVLLPSRMTQTLPENSQPLARWTCRVATTVSAGGCVQPKAQQCNRLCRRPKSGTLRLKTLRLQTLRLKTLRSHTTMHQAHANPPTLQTPLKASKTLLPRIKRLLNVY
jgi:hypothetical protein